MYHVGNEQLSRRVNFYRITYIYYETNYLKLNIKIGTDVLSKLLLFYFKVGAKINKMFKF